jgi:predicted transcriptional regulator
MELIMTRKNLKVILLRKGLTITKIATGLGVTTMAVYDVLKGRTTSKRIETTLETVFGMPIENIRKAWATPGEAVITSDIKSTYKELGIQIPAQV